MSFFDDEINAGDTYVPDMTADEYGGPSANAGSMDVYGPPTAEEMKESVHLALTSGMSSEDAASSGQRWWDTVVNAFSGNTKPGEDAMAHAGANQPRAAGDAKQEESKGLLGRIEDFATKNKSLTEMLLKGVAGAASAKNANKAATAQMREKDQIERERNKQYSDSISALAKPATGILGRAKPLKRIDGTQVFSNGRIA